MFRKIMCFLILIFMMASCLSNGNNRIRMTPLEYVKSLEFNTKMENLLKPYNDEFAGAEYFILNKDAKGIDIAKAPDEYGKTYTLRSIEYKSDSILLFRFFDGSDNEISLEYEIDMSVRFINFVKYYAYLNYDMRTKSWSYGDRNYDISKSPAYKMKYLNIWDLQISEFGTLLNGKLFMNTFTEFKSYTDFYTNSVYTQSSFERIKNEYMTDMKYHVNYVTSVPMNEIKEVGSIYRLMRPIEITNKIDSNMYAVREIEESSVYSINYWSWSDEYIFEVNDNIDTDELPESAVRNTYYTYNKLSGKIGYIVRFDGIKQFILKNGLIRMIPMFTLLGGNKYAYDNWRN